MKAASAIAMKSASATASRRTGTRWTGDDWNMSELLGNDSTVNGLPGKGNPQRQQSRSVRIRGLINSFSKPTIMTRTTIDRFRHLTYDNFHRIAQDEEGFSQLCPCFGFDR